MQLALSRLIPCSTSYSFLIVKISVILKFFLKVLNQDQFFEVIQEIVFFVVTSVHPPAILALRARNVAVVAGFVQIEGIASLKGHPFDEPDFIKVYKETQPEFYEKWRAGPRVKRERDMVVIKITPKRIALGRYADPEAGIRKGIYVLNARANDLPISGRYASFRRIFSFREGFYGFSEASCALECLEIKGTTSLYRLKKQ